MKQVFLTILIVIFTPLLSLPSGEANEKNYGCIVMYLDAVTNNNRLITDLPLLQEISMYLVDTEKATATAYSPANRLVNPQYIVGKFIIEGRWERESDPERLYLEVFELRSAKHLEKYSLQKTVLVASQEGAISHFKLFETEDVEIFCADEDKLGELIEAAAASPSVVLDSGSINSSMTADSSGTDGGLTK